MCHLDATTLVHLFFSFELRRSSGVVGRQKIERFWRFSWRQSYYSQNKTSCVWRNFTKEEIVNCIDDMLERNREFWFYLEHLLTLKSGESDLPDFWVSQAAIRTRQKWNNQFESHESPEKITLVNYSRKYFAKILVNVNNHLPKNCADFIKELKNNYGDFLSVRKCAEFSLGGTI